MEKMHLLPDRERLMVAASRIKDLLAASSDKSDWQHQDQRRQAMAQDLGLPIESPWPEVVDLYISQHTHDTPPKNRTMESALEELRESASLDQ